MTEQGLSLALFTTANHQENIGIRPGGFEIQQSSKKGGAGKGRLFERKGLQSPKQERMGQAKVLEGSVGDSGWGKEDFLKGPCATAANWKLSANIKDHGDVSETLCRRGELWKWLDA